MAHSDGTRPTLRPPGHHSIQPVSLPLESEPPTSDVAGEDFLYHLSRGSELLKENQVEQAKEALEVALSLQPRDLQGQGLLGVVYFRLGLYPRAISIYRQIVDAYADEVTPKVNLALCYVKTGQQQAARELLEDVVRRNPEHYRAWAYLGLVFQFQRDFAKAETAFERAGQRGMAERMRLLVEQSEVVPDEDLVPRERWEVRAAAEDAFGELESRTTPFHLDPSASREAIPNHSRWTATEPGEESIPAADRPPRRQSTPPPSFRPPSFPPPPLPFLAPAELSIDAPSSAPTRVVGRANALAEPHPAAVRLPLHHRLHLRQWLHERSPSACGGQAAAVDARTIMVELGDPFAVRANAVLAVSPSEVAKRELRVSCRVRSTEPAEPLGGAQSPIIGFIGPGKLLVRAQSGIVELFELDDESITVREASLFGISLGLRYEAERMKLGRNEILEVVKVSGRGTVALNLPAQAMTLELVAEGLVVRLAELVGWTARVLPESVDPAEAPGHARGFVALAGEGTAIVV
jgi:hypothetical protein